MKSTEERVQSILKKVAIEQEKQQTRKPHSRRVLLTVGIAVAAALAIVFAVPTVLPYLLPTSFDTASVTTTMGAMAGATMHEAEPNFDANGLPDSRVEDFSLVESDTRFQADIARFAYTNANQAKIEVFTSAEAFTETDADLAKRDSRVDWQDGLKPEIHFYTSEDEGLLAFVESTETYYIYYSNELSPEELAAFIREHLET